MRRASLNRRRFLLHLPRNFLLDADDDGRLGPLGKQWLAEVDAKLDALDHEQIAFERELAARFNARVRGTRH